MLKKITAVYPQPRAWGDKFPDNCSVMVQFDDGSQGEVATKKDKAEGIKEILKGLIGKDTEFVMDGEPRDFQGILQYKIKEYPGKPAGGGGFGGGGGGSSWANSEIGQRFEQERMDRRTALMQAVAFGSDKSLADVQKAADALYAWLRQTAGNVSTPAPAAQTASAATTAAPSGTTASTEKTVWAGPELCPSCNAPAGKYHADKCEYKDPFADD